MNKRTKLLAGLTGYARSFIDDTWSVVGMRPRPASPTTPVDTAWSRVGRHLSAACASIMRAQAVVHARTAEEEAQARKEKGAEQDGQREARELWDGDSIKPRGDQRGSTGFGGAGKR